MLALYNPEAPTKVSAHASSYGLGAVLMQKSGSSWKPIAFVSQIDNRDQTFIFTDWHWLARGHVRNSQSTSSVRSFISKQATNCWCHYWEQKTLTVSHHECFGFVYADVLSRAPSITDESDMAPVYRKKQKL